MFVIRPKKKAKTSVSTSTSTSTPTSTSTSTSTCANEDDQWKETDCGTLLYLHHPSTSTLPHRTKIAGFDIDDTIIKTKSGKTFATNDLTDWQLWADATTVMKPAFAKLASDGYRIVFFTNQEGISKGRVNKQSWKRKVEDVIDALGLSHDDDDGGVGVTVMASLTKKENDFRKPHVGMWTFLCENLTTGGGGADTRIRCGDSFYVGDAAGRPKRGTAKKDFSCTDYKFALNVGDGITFQTPEQFFYKSNKPSDTASLTTSNMGFQPRQRWSAYLRNDDGDGHGDGNGDHSPINADRENFLSSCRQNRKSGQKEIVVVVGSPASGKSEVTRRVILLNDDDIPGVSMEYLRINQDTLKTHAKCIKAATQAMVDGNSVIVDNTNRDTTTRSKYIALAKEHGVPCRCVWMKTLKEESFHMNALRGAVGDSDGGDKRSVPDVVIHSFYKNIEAPTVGQGFAEVIEIPFTPGPFDSEDRRNAFFRFTH